MGKNGRTDHFTEHLDFSLCLPFNAFHQTRVQLQVVPQNILYVLEHSCVAYYHGHNCQHACSCSILAQQVYYSQKNLVG
jgi:hypothetical protein